MSDVRNILPSFSSEGRAAGIVYILYLAGLLVGVTGLVGVVMAYVFNGDGPEWAQSRYRLQIRTFWIGILYSVIAFLLIPIVIGKILLLLVAIWFIIRCVRGLRFAWRNEPHPNPATWMF